MNKFLIACDKQQHSAILAALRYWQMNGSPLPSGIDDIATSGGEHPLIEPDALDQLCEEGVNGAAQDTPQALRLLSDHFALSFSDCIQHFAVSSEDSEIVTKALEMCNEGTLEIDDPAVISEGDDNGAYVMAWLWVPGDDEDETDDDTEIHE